MPLCSPRPPTSAGRPENRAAGAYNLIDATGVPIDVLEAECRRLHRMIAEEIDGLALRDDRLVRATLVRGLRHSIAGAFAATPLGGRSVPAMAMAGATLCTLGTVTPAVDGGCSLRGCRNCCGEFCGNCCCDGVCDACCSTCDCS